MRIKRAFTLIEVMVVLSLLAIIAILAYNFFGGTMKEARESQVLTKTLREMSTISAAVELRAMQDYNNNHVNATADILSDMAPLAGAGYLKSDINIDTQWTPTFNYRYDRSNVLGGTETDVILNVRRVDADLCRKFNEKYTSLGYAYAPWPHNDIAFCSNAMPWDNGQPMLIYITYRD